MQKIDTTNWLPFRVGDLFDIHPTKAYKLNNAQLMNNGKNPVVVNSAYNNGIGGYSSYATTEKGNIITFSDTVDANTIFYHKDEFIGYPHVQGLYPKGDYVNCWNEGRLLFFASIFRKTALAKGFDYGNKFRRDIAAELVVKLPATSGKEPNWQYMEDYMRGVEQRAKNSLSALLDVKRLPKPINTAYWARFPLYSEHLFHIDMGSKMDRIKMTKVSPKINFVGRGSVNNGVVDCVDIIDDVKPYDAGCLTLSLGGSIGLTYIQEKPFYTSQNVCVLIPNSNMSLYCKRFISTMITCEGQRRYKAFIDELNRHIKTDFSILLPTKSDGEPDWQYMEMYMRGVEAIAKNKIDALQQSKKSVSPSPQTPFTNYGTVNIIDNSRNYNIK